MSEQIIKTINILMNVAGFALVVMVAIAIEDKSTTNTPITTIDVLMIVGILLIAMILTVSHL